MKKLYKIDNRCFSFPIYDSNYNLIFLNRYYEQKYMFCIRLDENIYDFSTFKNKIPNIRDNNGYVPGSGRNGIKYLSMLINDIKCLIEEKYVIEIK